MSRPLRDVSSANLPTSWAELFRASDERTVIRRTASGAIGGGRAVVSSGSSAVAYASAAQSGHMHTFIGVTTGAAADGAPSDVVTQGQVDDSSWSFTAGLPVFVSSAIGLLTQATPAYPASLFALRIGVALSPTSLFVSPGMPVALI